MLEPAAASLSENDLHALILGGQALAIEAADTTLQVATTTSAFAAAETNTSPESGEQSPFRSAKNAFM